MCLELVLAGERLQFSLADPVKALHPPSDQSMQDSLARSATENAPRVAAQVARAVRTRDLSALDVWLASLGPVVSALLEQRGPRRDRADARAAARAEEGGAEARRGLRAREDA